MITAFFKPKNGGKDEKAKQMDPQPGPTASPSTVSSTSTSTSTSGQAADDHRKRSNPYLKTGGSSSSSSGGGSASASSATTSSKRPKTNDGNDTAVTAIISVLNDDNEDGKDESNSSSWKKSLNKHFSKPSFVRLAKFVQSERQKHTIYPPPNDVFTALNLTPLSSVKVVIVGQDPYHGPKQAHGLCFSIRRDSGIPPPPSLKNIYKELINDTNIPNFTTAPKHGCLERWAKQGVLMINTVMTVRQGQANSHKKKGWEEVTDTILRAVRDRSSSSTTNGGGGVVFLLWGKPATEKTKTILSSSSSGGVFCGATNSKKSATTAEHKVISTSHPSPLGATKTNSPFLGSRCFSRANEMLVEMGHEPIDWRLD